LRPVYKKNEEDLEGQLFIVIVVQNRIGAKWPLHCMLIWVTVTTFG